MSFEEHKKSMEEKAELASIPKSPEVRQAETLESIKVRLAWVVFFLFVIAALLALPYVVAAG